MCRPWIVNHDAFSCKELNSWCYDLNQIETMKNASYEVVEFRSDFQSSDRILWEISYGLKRCFRVATLILNFNYFEMGWLIWAESHLWYKHKETMIRSYIPGIRFSNFNLKRCNTEVRIFTKLINFTEIATWTPCLNPITRQGNSKQNRAYWRDARFWSSKKHQLVQKMLDKKLLTWYPYLDLKK